MLKRLLSVGLLIAITIFQATAAEARIFERGHRLQRRAERAQIQAKNRLQRRQTRQTNWRVRIRPEDQRRAEKEAATMQSNNIRGHVSTTIGKFEGVGWASPGTQPGTCTPATRMTLTADATKCGPNGCFRVRAWR